MSESVRDLLANLNDVDIEVKRVQSELALIWAKRHAGTITIEEADAETATLHARADALEEMARHLRSLLRALVGQQRAA